MPTESALKMTPAQFAAVLAELRRTHATEETK